MLCARPPSGGVGQVGSPMAGENWFDYALRGLPVAASIALTPLIMRGWAKLAPRRSVDDPLTRENLHRRFSWIDRVAQALFFVGLASPWPLFNAIPRHDPAGLWLIGLMFGMAVLIPCLWIALATLPFGLRRFHEFWLFYELRWGVGVKGLLPIYVPLSVLGIVSAVQVWTLLR
jgi:hypothetical protein